VAEKQVWNPTKKERLEAHYKWLLKQSKQRRQTLRQKGVRYYPEYQEQLESEARWYKEEAKRIKDLIEDGK
jgi:hypothetical protein